MQSNPRPVKTMTQLLRDELMDTITGVKSGKIKPEQANAVTQLSSQVLASAKLDLEVLKFRQQTVRRLPPAVVEEAPPETDNGVRQISDNRRFDDPVLQPETDEEGNRLATAYVRSCVRSKVLVDSKNVMRLLRTTSPEKAEAFVDHVVMSSGTLSFEDAPKNGALAEAIA